MSALRVEHHPAEDRDEDSYKVILDGVGELYEVNVAYEVNDEGESTVELELVQADGTVLDHDVLVLGTDEERVDVPA